jgi:hypothetical protein
MTLRGTLGKNQLQRLLGMASPTCLLIVAEDRIAKSLVARGLTAPRFPDDPNAWHRITPKGMRALADALDAGQLDQFMQKFPRERTGHAFGEGVDKK